jgi:hypothetical protein
VSPAEEIRAAAERLRTLASAAADASGSPHWRATRLIPELPDATYTTLGTVDGPPFLRGGGRGGPPAYVSAPIGDYIATMGPSVGKALAAWLDSWGVIDLREHAAMQEDARHALAIARAINGGEQR